MIQRLNEVARRNLGVTAVVYGLVIATVVLVMAPENKLPLALLGGATSAIFYYPLHRGDRRADSTVQRPARRLVVGSLIGIFFLTSAYLLWIVLSAG